MKISLSDLNEVVKLKILDNGNGADKKHVDPPHASPVKMLSDREQGIFRLIGEGMTTAAIARRLHLSPNTVDAHHENTAKKLNVKNAAELQRLATQWLLDNG